MNSHLEAPTYLHFVCSPKRAREILSEIDEIGGWTPRCVFEPVPVRPSCPFMATLDLMLDCRIDACLKNFLLFERSYTGYMS